MKKIILLVLALALLLCLSACGDFVSILPGTAVDPDSVPVSTGAGGTAAGFGETPLLTFLGWESLGDSYYTDTPAALSYERVDGEGGCRSYVFDRAGIIAGCDALRGMTVIDRAEGEPVIKEEYRLSQIDRPEYVFTFGTLGDGTRVLITYTGNFIVSGGEGLWNLAFPAYSPEYDVFDLYFSDSVRGFADNFYEYMPVSVGYRLSSGATVTSTDPQTVTAAFQALAATSVIVVENNPDLNVDLNQTRDYIFTMADGTAYTFRFAQRCLSVTANAAFGPVYYWLNGVDALWNVSITSEDTASGFQGGYVWELREDMELASRVVDGSVEGVSVSGVYVNYTIGENSGYLTLSGDTALSFLRELFQVRVTGDAVEVPAGDTFTVSVTLSDGTGPFLSFTGDCIQQMAGVNYYCVSEDMQALRSRILELGAAGNNTATVGDSTTE